MYKILLALPVVLFTATSSIACPNAATSVTIPLSGEAVVTVYDSVTCNPLAGPFSVQIPGSSLGPTTKPSVTIDGAGLLHFTDNGAPFGTRISATVQFLPDTSKSQSLAILVGGPVTSLNFGTTSP